MYVEAGARAQTYLVRLWTCSCDYLYISVYQALKDRWVNKSAVYNWCCSPVPLGGHVYLKVSSGRLVSLSRSFGEGRAQPYLSFGDSSRSLNNGDIERAESTGESVGL